MGRDGSVANVAWRLDRLPVARPDLHLCGHLLPVLDHLQDLEPILVRPEFDVPRPEGDRAGLPPAGAAVNPLARFFAFADSLVDPTLTVEAPEGPLPGL